MKIEIIIAVEISRSGGIAMGIAPEYAQYLAELSQAEDLVEARQLCQQFLQVTASHASFVPPKTPQDLFAALLSGYKNAQADQLLAAMTHTAYRSYILVVLSSDFGQDHLDAISSQVAAQPDHWSVFHENRLVCIAASRQEPLDTAPFVQAARKYSLFGGISRPFSSISMLENAYLQGTATLKTLKILERTRTAARYDDFLMIRLLDGLRDDVKLEDFCLPDIQALQAYDKQHDTELGRTLLCYLEHAKNATNTAQELNVHRNTVHYRINKCMELLPQLDFSNDYMTFLLMLSLHIAEYDKYRKMLDRAKSLT
jgi:DNA-binding PucR family transcriptional regulator